MQNNNSLISQKESCVLLVDVQEKFVPIIHQFEKMKKRCSVIIEAANELSIPVYTTEHYPEKLGSTEADLKALIDPSRTYSKEYMSCTGCSGFMNALEMSDKKQVILIGIEAHVCVLQTAFGLLSKNIKPYIVADAISSRSLLAIDLAKARFRQYDIDVVHSEMVLFEWLEHGNGPHFKKIMNLIK